MLLHDVPYHIQQLVGSPTVLFTPIYMSMGACISLGEFSLCRPRQCGRPLQFVRHITHHREINCQLERWCESAASCAFNGFSTRDNLHFEVKSLLESAPSALTGNGDSVNRTTRENRCRWVMPYIPHHSYIDPCLHHDVFGEFTEVKAKSMLPVWTAAQHDTTYRTCDVMTSLYNCVQWKIKS